MLEKNGYLYAQGLSLAFSSVHMYCDGHIPMQLCMRETTVAIATMTVEE